jgi:hypothetical protein
VASQAQINANKRNSQRSTGPKTEDGKAPARLNALKGGTHAKAVNRVLPQENAAELDELIKRWINDEAQAGQVPFDGEAGDGDVAAIGRAGV